MLSCNNNMDLYNTHLQWNTPPAPHVILSSWGTSTANKQKTAEKFPGNY